MKFLSSFSKHRGYAIVLCLLSIIPRLLLAYEVNPECLEDPNKCTTGESILEGAATSSVRAGFDVASTYTLSEAIGAIIQTALLIIGTLFMTLVVYAGYLWLTAQGDSQQVTKAREIITAAVIGIVITMSAYSISYFILYQASRASQYDTGIPVGP
jgi:hypothetical protein